MERRTSIPVRTRSQRPATGATCRCSSVTISAMAAPPCATLVPHPRRLVACPAPIRLCLAPVKPLPTRSSTWSAGSASKKIPQSPAPAIDRATSPSSAAVRASSSATKFLKLRSFQLAIRWWRSSCATSQATSARRKKSSSAFSRDGHSLFAHGGAPRPRQQNPVFAAPLLWHKSALPRTGGACRRLRRCRGRPGITVPRFAQYLLQPTSHPCLFRLTARQQIAIQRSAFKGTGSSPGTHRCSC